MTSTNFEFIRSRWPDLADDATSAERDLHTNQRSAMRSLRTLCEATLGNYFQRKGNVNLGKLLQDHHSVIPRDLKNRLDYLLSSGNKATHYKAGVSPALIDISEALRHLQTAFDLAVWIVTELEGKRPAVEFIEPPRGGEREAKLRRDRDEALREIRQQRSIR